jgi:hypothetical protein
MSYLFNFNNLEELFSFEVTLTEKEDYDSMNPFFTFIA